MLGDELRRLRKERGLTQAQLAEKWSIAQSTIASYESGKRKPDLEQLAFIADFYGVNIDSLMGHESAEESRNRLMLDERHIIDLYRRLNQEGKGKAFEYLLLLQHDFREVPNAQT